MEQEPSEKKSTSIMLRILWGFSTPSLIHGIIVGLSLSMLVYAMVTLEVIRLSLGFLIAGGLFLILGVFIGYYLTTNLRKKPDETEDIDNGFSLFFNKLTTQLKNSETSEDYTNIYNLIAVNIEELTPVAKNLQNRVYGIVTRFLALTGLAGFMGIIVSFAIFVATFMQVERLGKQNELIQTQNQLAEATRRSGLVFELTSILNEIDEEIDEDNDRRLRHNQMKSATEILTKEQTINFKLTRRLEGRIVALSRSLRPYKYLEYQPNVEKVELVQQALSPERAQLLVSLLASGINLTRITETGDFTQADLRKADLRGANLMEINLQNSNLSEARLGKGFLGGFGVIGDRSGGATLDDNSEGRKTNLTSSDLRNSIMIDTNLSNVILSSAILRHSILIGADLSSATLNHVDFTNAILASNKCRKLITLMISSDLSHTKFINTDLRGVLFGKNVLDGTTFFESDLQGAIVPSKNWIEDLESKNQIEKGIWTVEQKVEIDSGKKYYVVEKINKNSSSKPISCELQEERD